MPFVCLDFKPPCPTELAVKPYPMGYIVSKLQLFDGRRGNTWDHIVRFLDLMDPFAHDIELCLREFSKSLTDRAYTMYVNLKPGSVHYWEQLLSISSTKFVCVEPKISFLFWAKLSLLRQYPGQDLDLYIRRFHKKAIDCCDVVDEEICMVCWKDIVSL